MSPVDAPDTSSIPEKAQRPPLFIRLFIWYIDWRNAREARPRQRRFSLLTLVLLIIALLILLLGVGSMLEVLALSRLQPVGGSALMQTSTTRVPTPVPTLNSQSTQQLPIPPRPTPTPTRPVPTPTQPVQTISQQENATNVSCPPSIFDKYFWNEVTQCTVSDLAVWAVHGMFDAFQTHISGFFTGTFNIFTQTPAGLTYKSSPVNTLMAFMVGLVNTASVVYVVLAGYLMMIKSEKATERLQALPTLCLAVIAANFVNGFYPYLIDLNNALCQYLMNYNAFTTMQAFVGRLVSPGLFGYGSFVLDWFLLGLVVLMILLVTIFAGSMLIRIAWLDVLIILLPVALFFLGSQLTQSLGKSMLLAFLRTLYVQFVQVLSLTLGFSLFNSFVNGLGPDQKFMYLAVACANVYLTIRIPGFMDIASGKGSLLTEAAITVVGTYTGAWKSLSKPEGK